MGDVTEHGNEPAVGVVDEDEIVTLIHRMLFR